MVKDSTRRDGSFYIPDFIEIQKKSFSQFLEVGILTELQKMGPIFAKAGEIEIIFYPNRFILTPPDYTIKKSILEGKTYESKLYVPAKIVAKGGPEKEVEWILVGSIPLMTRRGHFIINGSPRVIVNQMVRSPGIYFHRRLTGRERQVYSVDLIPLAGSWLRLEEKIEEKEEEEKNIEKKEEKEEQNQLYAYLKRTPKIPYHLLSNSMAAFEMDICSEEETFCLPWKYRQRLALHLLDRVVTDTIDGRDIKDATKKLDELQEKIKLVFEKIKVFKREKSILKGEWLLQEFSHFKNSIVSFIEAENDFHLRKKMKVVFQKIRALKREGSIVQKRLDFESTFVDFIKSEEDPTSFSNGVIEANAITKSDIGPLTERDYIIFTKRDIDAIAAKIDLDPLTESEVKAITKRKGALETIAEIALDSSTQSDVDAIAAKIDLDPLTERDFDFLNDGDGDFLNDGDGDNITESDDDPITESNDDPVAKSDVDPITEWEKILKITSYSLDLVLVRKEEKGARSKKMKGTGSLATYLAFDKIKREMEGRENRVDTVNTLRLLSKKAEAEGWKDTKEILGIWTEKAEAEGRINNEKTEEEKDILTEMTSFFFLWALPCGWQGGRAFLYDKFKNPATYTLGRLGRARLDKKLEDRAMGSLLSCRSTQLMARDLQLAYTYLRRVQNNNLLVDDIDHLKNRRVKTCGELLQNQFQVGLDRLKTLLRFKVNRGEQSISLKRVIDAKALDGAWREFFGSNPLSQYMDQTNPLAEITHKRRVSCLGPGGVSRETAAMAMRGIHPSHYGRICPIETPEGKNAGLVNSLSVYTRVDYEGVLETPYYRLKEGQIQRRAGFHFFSAQREEDEKASIAPADIASSRSHLLPDAFLPVRRGENLRDNYGQTTREKIQYVGISRIQMISIATSLIPFLEHNDANRALMGSNMQRQAVPLLTVEPPIVGTGLEGRVVAESGHIVGAKKAGRVSYVSGRKIIVQRLNCSRNKGSARRKGFQEREWIPRFSRASLGRGFDIKIAPFSVLSLPEAKESNRPRGESRLFWKATLPFETLSSPSLASLRSLASFAREAKRSQRAKRNEATQDYSLAPSLGERSPRNERSEIKEGHPLLPSPSDRNKRSDGVSRLNPFALGYALQRGQIKYSNLCFPPSFREKAGPKEKLVWPLDKEEVVWPLGDDSYSLQTFQQSNQKTCLRHRPWVQEGDWVQPGDLLADCAASQGGQLSVGRNVVIAYLPWDGYNFEDAVVVSDRLLSDDLYTSLHIEQYETQIEEMERKEVTITKHNLHLQPAERASLDKDGVVQVGSWVETGDLLVSKVKLIPLPPLSGYERLAYEILRKKRLKTRDVSLRVAKWVEGRVIDVKKKFQKEKRGEPDKLISVRLHLVERKRIQVGDKVAGRHGNKGIVSTILPRQDMPYLPDGTTVDMVLNPLGVPSRMNVGQVFEALLGLAGGFLKQRFSITPFDEMYGSEASRSLVYLKLYQARLRTGHEWLFWPDFPGKMRIFDGRSGDAFHQPVTVGRAYMLKLIHLVDEKIHARARGPYSIITQQPVRGRGKGGGQRLGEMEVWALEGYGAAYTLQEILTTKSDDIEGRREVWKWIVEKNQQSGREELPLGKSGGFQMVLRELQSLCLDINIFGGKQHAGGKITLVVPDAER